jgi:hypothetical protein
MILTTLKYTYIYMVGINTKGENFQMELRTFENRREREKVNT